MGVQRGLLQVAESKVLRKIFGPKKDDVSQQLRGSLIYIGHISLLGYRNVGTWLGLRTQETYTQFW